MWGPEICVSISLPGDSEAYSNLGTIALNEDTSFLPAPGLLVRLLLATGSPKHYTCVLLTASTCTALLSISFPPKFPNDDFGCGDVGLGVLNSQPSTGRWICKQYLHTAGQDAERVRRMKSHTTVPGRVKTQQTGTWILLSVVTLLVPKCLHLSFIICKMEIIILSNLILKASLRFYRNNT